MNRFFLLCLTVLISALCMADNNASDPIPPVPAFPGAEGFGMYAQGGRGGRVVTVTSLDDYLSTEEPIPGTLRWALSQYVETQTIDGKQITVYTPLTVVFNVAGNIVLKEDLKVKRDYLTIAGQTAPGDGICITGHSMLFNGATGGEMWYYGPRRKHLVVRYIRFRPTPPASTADPVTYGTDVENYEQVIFDHCTMSWANEENLAMYDNKYTTLQYCLVAEGLYSANHKKGNRSYCGVWGGQFATYHHNLIAHNAGRNVRFDGCRAHDTVAVVAFYNNVVYNWGTTSSGYGLEVEVKVPGVTRNELNMFGNFYRAGLATSAGLSPSSTNRGCRLVRIDQDTASYNAGYHSVHYIESNVTDGYPQVTANNWFCGVQYNNSVYKNDTAAAIRLFRAADYSPEVKALLPEDPEDAYAALETTLAQAGAIAPKRDPQDARIVFEVRNDTAQAGGSYGRNKGIIDDPMVVGGWPVLQGTPYLDTDQDGMPDEWETANSLNPNDPADGNLLNEEGYTMLEVYMNSIPADITTLPQEVPAALWDVPANHEPATCVRQNGVIYILKNGQKYTLSGQIAE